jgi:hypothetical protein
MGGLVWPSTLHKSSSKDSSTVCTRYASWMDRTSVTHPTPDGSCAVIRLQVDSRAWVLAMPEVG